MGSATGMNQLFRNLCHHTMWKYAIFWKFQHENRMVLTCEDSYAIDTKSGIAMEFASYEELVSRHPWESNTQSGNDSVCSIIVAVSNMTQISYLLGEGIVGKVASREDHQWICVEEMTSDLLLECPEEFGLQFEAGIKTILLLPVYPLGLVQLGSLEKLSEDLFMVAQLKELFCPYQYTSLSGLRMEKTDSSRTYNNPSLDKYSTCLEINSKLTDPLQSQSLTIPDFTSLSFDQVTVNELLPIGSVFLPHSVPHSFNQLTEDDLHQVHELDTNLFDEIGWSAMCSELFGDYSDEQFMLNTSTFIERTIESAPMTSLHENEAKMIPVIGHRLASKNTMFDPCDFKKTLLTFVEEFDLIIESTPNSKCMDFSIGSEPHKAMEQSYLVGCKNSEWMDNKSKAVEGSELINNFKEGIPKTFGFSDKEQCLVMNENRSKYLPSVPNGKELKSYDFAKSRCSSTGRCTDSCLTQCKAEEMSNSEDSDLESHKVSSLISDSEGFKTYPTTSQLTSSFHMAPKNMDKKDNVYGFWSSCLKEQHISHRQTKNKCPGKPRPRDRQLIQDRIRELRELIPNSAKCSVDALLQRTVDHMMFLRSVPIHANKLKQTTSPKVEDNDLNVPSTRVTQTEAHWAREAGNKLGKLPLIIENMEQPDQMLVEMQCKNYKLFLEIAQAIKRLGLTILKGILESRYEELWAHFIVEIPKGFHRTDIIWPLMQLLL